MSKAKTIRAWSTFELKSMRDDQDGKRRFTGIATTPNVDRAGDVVEPMGAEFQLPIPLLWQHDASDPVGWVTSAKVTAKGIEIEGEVAQIDAPASLKDRLETAWAKIKAKLVRGLSIGFQPLESSRIEGTYSYRYLKWSWLELSAVTIPMNADASITAVKAADMLVLRSASGAQGARRVVALRNLPGDTGASANSVATKGHNIMKISEQLAAFDARRKGITTRMEELMSKAGEEGRTLDASETEEYDGLAADLKAVDEHTVRLKAHEANMVAKAAPVAADAGRPAPGTGMAYDLGSRQPISVQRNAPKGTAFTRYCMALAVSKGNIVQAERLAALNFKDTPEVSMVLRAAADAGTTSDATWAGPLVQYQDMVSEFIDLLRNATILGRMNAVRRVPFNVRIPRKTAGSTGAFVGEGAATPVREMAFDNITHPWAKASSIIVVSAELARMSNPAAEAMCRQDLLDGISEFLDKRLIDPAFAGVSGTSPASLTYNVTPRQASGATLAAIDDDVAVLMRTYAAANLGLSTGVWVMSPSLAISLSMMRTSQDEMAFPGMGVNGGTFYGLPAITSNAVQPSGSPGDLQLILVNQNEVLLSDDGQMTVEASAEASLQMNDAPAAGAQSLVSLWQNGLLGLKVDRWIYWSKRRSQAVQYIDGAQRYGA
jgi:HK97 family phage major capsid protein/HK97 family phage prohead protease